jgi:hypothetical protein
MLNYRGVFWHYVSNYWGKLQVPSHPPSERPLELLLTMTSNPARIKKRERERRRMIRSAPSTIDDVPSWAP